MEPEYAPGKYKPPPVQKDYPCWVTFAVMGKNEAGVLKAVQDVAGKQKYHLKSFKSTEKRAGFTIHVEVYVYSDFQRTEIFHNFQMHPQVRWVV
jgi:putative lipoic acid-binding regulatory protein